MNTVILSAVRTPIGSFNGTLQSVSAPRLGAIAIKEAIIRAGIESDMIDEVIMGQVLTAGVGQAPTRQAAIYAGLPVEVRCLTINKVCGSGMKSVALARQSIMSLDSEIVVAGGQESMSQAPYLLKNARTGLRMGNSELIDSMVFDGLTDPYSNSHMGETGENCSLEFAVTRAEQDDFSEMSYRRALNAIDQDFFYAEIVPVKIESRKGNITIDKDEEPFKVAFEKIRSLKPVFKSDGCITAANASSINDGAAALVLCSDDKAELLGKSPIARIITYSEHSQQPDKFTSAPLEAIAKVLAKANLNVEDIDLFEINEAFSVVPIIAAKKFNIPLNKLNIHGGAVSLGHPIGASGARILTTLIHSLRKYNKRYGLATLCIGGGEAVAMIIESL